MFTFSSESLTSIKKKFVLQSSPNEMLSVYFRLVGMSVSFLVATSACLLIALLPDLAWKGVLREAVRPHAHRRRSFDGPELCRLREYVNVCSVERALTLVSSSRRGGGSEVAAAFLALELRASNLLEEIV